VVKFVNNAATISTSAELIAALSPANAGRRVHLRAGTYDIDRLLTIPDGMTIDGEGVMAFAPQGYATGFRDGPRTTLRMRSSTGGNLLTLGNNVNVRNVEIIDLEGRSGNLVAVLSRRPGDRVAATITESVLVNPNVLSITAGSAYGRGLYIATRNDKLQADPPPDEGSVLNVKLGRSVIRSPVGGGGFFVFNFAAKSRISLDIWRSLIGGSDEAVGGVSRPDSVHDSEVRITSRENVYRNEWTDLCAQALLGWNLTGGGGAPIPLTLPETARNRLIVNSTNDRIEGFTTGILATASRRFYPSPRNGPSTDNHIDLKLVGTTISTPACAAGEKSENTSGIPTFDRGTIADLRLIGGNVTSEGLEPGDGNTLRAELQGVTGSGKRGNRYANAGGSLGPLAPGLRGKGNRLEIVGDPDTFRRSNHAIEPMPGAEFFIGKR
jgi:hypothetical protein